MENRITIREAVTENDVAAFWEQLHAYHKRDIFPDSDTDELEYFLGSEYHDRIMEIYSRPKDRCFFLFFRRDGRDIGFAMPVIFTSEDGKCFIMEYCIYPEFRGNGTGKECAGVLLDWAIDRYKKPWSEQLPENDRLTVNGTTYVHWYDCITDYIL